MRARTHLGSPVPTYRPKFLPRLPRIAPTSFVCIGVLLFTFFTTFRTSSLPVFSPSFSLARIPVFSSPSPQASIAYFIQVTPESLGHLSRLYSRIHHPQNLIAIHFDITIPATNVSASVASLRSTNDNFHADTIIIPSRKVVYRGISMVLNTLHAMTELLEYANWDFFINLSGHDYPMLQVSAQRAFLGSVKHLEPTFLGLVNRIRSKELFEYRAKTVVVDPILCFPPTSPHEHHENANCNRLSDPYQVNMGFDHSFVPYMSGAWMIASRSFCRNATSSSISRHILVSYANMYSSAEYFFATLAQYTPGLNNSLVAVSLRKVIWVADGKSAGQHPYYLDERKEDGSYRFVQNLNKSNAFFGRKFREANSDLMDIVDELGHDVERERRMQIWFKDTRLKLEKYVEDAKKRSKTKALMQ